MDIDSIELYPREKRQRRWILDWPNMGDLTTLALIKIVPSLHGIIHTWCTVQTERPCVQPFKILLPAIPHLPDLLPLRPQNVPNPLVSEDRANWNKHSLYIPLLYNILHIFSQKYRCLYLLLVSYDFFLIYQIWSS